MLGYTLNLLLVYEAKVPKSPETLYNELTGTSRQFLKGLRTLLLKNAERDRPESKR